MTKKINKKLMVLLTAVSLVTLAITAYFYFVYVPNINTNSLTPRQKEACERLTHEKENRSPMYEATEPSIDTQYCPPNHR